MSKYQGTGNDFILIDDRDETFPLSLIPRLCHRKFGVGADGVILFQKPLKMRIFNSDGKEAASCGNGLRCFVLFLQEIGLVQESYQIEIGSQIISAKRFGNDQVAVQLGSPSFLQLQLPTAIGPVHFVHIGVPHVVRFVSNVAEADLARIGPLLRHHSLFAPEGANVNLVEILGDHALKARTFERGVEGETLACGTGAASIVAIYRALYSITGPVRVFFPGGALLIEREWMMGPAQKIFSGYLKNIFDS